MSEPATPPAAATEVAQPTAAEIATSDGQAVASLLPSGMTEWLNAHPWLGASLVLVGVVALSFIVMLVVRKLVLPAIGKVVRKTQWKWDDVIFDNQVFRWVSWLPGLLVLFYGIALLATLNDALGGVVVLLQNVTEALIIMVIARAISALLRATNELYNSREIAKDRPIKGYIQIVQILVYCIAGILMIAALADQSPWIFLSGIGAMTAVLLLIFKDTILSLVASIQLTSNDMLRVGDWLEMPSVGADGDVIDIALHTVKVQNWDKTISTIPTHKLISASFKNWRGMQESGGRRIKRNLTIDCSTIRFLTDEEIERFASFDLLSSYITDKRNALNSSNADKGDGVIVNQRRLTNVGTLRAYIVNYLRERSDIHDSMTFLVRQLQPGEAGLPIEIYVFTKTVVWAQYEAIQADIFDHLLAMIPEFGLRVYQQPSGADLASALASLNSQAN